MKYHEAIDMILDGGEAYRAGDPVFKFSFNEKSDFLVRAFNSDEPQRAICFDKDDITKTDWVVEKDGAVYDEYIDEWDRKEWVACSTCLKPHASFCCKQGESEEVKMPIIADEVNEDWLEKKILCFMKRAGVAVIYKCDYEEDEVEDLSFVTVKNTSSICNDEDCPFCFPQEQTKPDHIPDVSNMVREKVTAEELNLGLTSILDAAISSQAHELPKVIRDHHHDTYVKRRNYFFEKLEYLVSLQEKVK